MATRLMRALVEHAVRTGVGRVRVDVLCENLPVLDWIRRSLPGVAFERDGNTLTGTTPLSPVVLTARDYELGEADLLRM